MLNKVMKKMQQLEDAKNPKAKKSASTDSKSAYPSAGSVQGGGFDARKNSTKGAARARSIGNRLRKPSSNR